MASLLGFKEKEKLGQRVMLDAYYRDKGAHAQMYETVMIGANGCVTIRDSCSGRMKCLSIADFRESYWLIQPAKVDQCES